MTDEQFEKLDWRLRNIANKAALQRFGIALILSAIMLLLVGKAHATDLVPPKRPPLMQTGRFPVLAPEACLEPGKEPYAGQTLHADKRCKSGLRWIYQR